ncbi:ABC transporter permease [Actinomadura chibensis]|uniref:Transport permease protein n=1 Tax=Actinomadura chibensis TaxID=392828 RepID=A0A5D0NLG3_9ACTN|nr:ABC transporter permease [Actinomadura chibensis]TYB45316.1 ABC transporter permease [Actinomadura chibensis]
MTTAPARVPLIAHSALLTGRLLRGLRRTPAFLVIGLVQPVIWLLLFGQLFRAVVNLPGFAHGDGGFLQFLTPGVVMMTALFASAWAGTTHLQDIERGVMDRMLTSPAHRGALVIASLACQAVQALVQSLVILAVAVVAGARFPGGAAGAGATLLSAVLLTLIFSALSGAVALLTRRQETLIAISQFTTLPLMFLSSAVMDLGLAPAWVGRAADCNPVEWAVAASREAMLAHPDWSAVTARLGLLAAAALVMGLLSTRAFRAYRNSA